MGSLLGNIPIVGSLFGGGGQPAAPAHTNHPAYGGAYPGYPQTQGPTAYPGWPVPQPGPQPTYDFTGDQSGPGAGENFYAQNQGKFTAPTQTGGYWQQNQQRFGQPGQGDQFWNQAQGAFNQRRDPTNDAQQAYTQFQNSAPANTDPFYSHAIDVGTHNLQNAQAAQGILGSTAGTQQIGDLNANLLGQQAAANANYGLQRGQTAGSLASGADLSSRGASQDMLGWLGGLGNLGLGTQNADLQSLMAGGSLAGQADNMGLAGLMSGMNAALGSQGALRGRANDYFGNLMQMANAEGGNMANIYGTMLGNDQNLFDNSQQAYLGYPREQMNQGENSRNSVTQGIGSFLGGLTGIASAGGLANLPNNFMNGAPKK